MLLINDALGARYDRWSSACPIRHSGLLLDSDDGNDDGDDDCGHVLIPLSYYHSLISSYTRVSIVVLMNMLICRMLNIYPLLQDGSDRWSAVLLLCSAIHGSDTWRTTICAILVPCMFTSVKLTCACLLMLSCPSRSSRYFKRIRWLRVAKSALLWRSWSTLFLAAAY